MAAFAEGRPKWPFQQRKCHFENNVGEHQVQHCSAGVGWGLRVAFDLTYMTRKWSWLSARDKENLSSAKKTHTHTWEKTMKMKVQVDAPLLSFKVLQTSLTSLKQFKGVRNKFYCSWMPTQPCPIRYPTKGSGWNAQQLERGHSFFFKGRHPNIVHISQTLAFSVGCAFWPSAFQT